MFGQDVRGLLTPFFEHKTRMFGFEVVISERKLSD